MYIKIVFIKIIYKFRHELYLLYLLKVGDVLVEVEPEVVFAVELYLIYVEQQVALGVELGVELGLHKCKNFACSEDSENIVKKYQKNQFFVTDKTCV